MSHLTPRERELVSLGAAMGSNCVSCIEYHIPASKRAGLTEAQISEAIRLADKLRRVPARKVLATALFLLPKGLAIPPAEHDKRTALAGLVGAARQVPASADTVSDDVALAVQNTRPDKAACCG